MQMYKTMEKVDIHVSESLCIVFYQLYEYYNWSYVQGWTVAVSVSVSQHVYGEVVRGIMIRMQQYHLREFHP